MRSWKTALLALTVMTAAGGTSARAETTLNAVLEAEIVTIDPHFNGAYILRTFGYMVYDTLFAPDSKGAFKPQMVAAWTVSDDKKTWRFTLRDGLKFHDGAPVTATDVVASLKRWSTRNAMGARLMKVTASLEPTDPKAFVLTLTEPYGLVIETLGTTLGPGPFIMPARIAATPGAQQIKEIVGSGPFVYDPAQHRPGDHMKLRKNADYVSRAEPTDFLTGAKTVKVDALDIRFVPDAGTATNALQRGELDYMQYAPFDLMPVLAKDKNLKLLSFSGPHMFTGHYRFNFVQKPFDDPAIRRVVLQAVDQAEVLDGLGLGKEFAQTCDSFFICGSAYATPNPAAPKDHSIAAAQAALKATKYAGEPVVVMVANDLEAPRVASTLLADRLKKVGFNVDMQVIDWATLLQRRTQRTGWNMYGVHALGLDLQSPLTSSVITFNCTDSTAGGFMCEQPMVPLFEAFSHAPSPDAQREVAGQIQKVVYEQALGVPFGQFAQPAAYSAKLDGLIPSAIPLFWGVEKK